MNVLGIKKIGEATVIVDIVQKGNFEIRPGYAMIPSEITIHNTGNNGRGANAKAHNIYIHNMANLTPKETGYASWHLSVDDKYIYQHIPFNESAWHTGDGSGLKSGNRNAIGIEICENPDMDYAKAEENAVALSAYLMNIFNIGINKVKPHQAYSGKYCPRVILKRDGSFSKFSTRVNKAKGVTTIIKESASVLLKRGDRSPEVKTLQENLNKLGHNAGIEDGIFGSGTENAVKSFQKSSNLTVDGIAGSQTLAKMQTVIQAANKVAPPKKESAIFTLGGKKFKIEEL